MPLPTIQVKDALDITRTIATPQSGRQADADSQSVAISAEGIAAITAVATAVVAALGDKATAANQSAGNALLTAIRDALQASLPLPTGAATAANQSTGNSTLADILAQLQAIFALDATGEQTIALEAMLALMQATGIFVRFAEAQEITGQLGIVADANLPVVAASNLPVVDGTAAFVFTPASGTSTGSAIAALGADANRKAFQFQNASDTDFTVNFDGTASASAGFLVAPGKVLEFYGAAAPKGAVSIFCGAASKRYVLRTA